jgi:hypothetical protein
MTLHGRSTLKTPTTRELSEFHAAIKPSLLQLLKRLHDLHIGEFVAIYFK